MIDKLGFTGSREAAPLAQAAALAHWMAASGMTELHHGDCVGRDEVAHQIARDLGWRIVIHPGDGPIALRAFCIGYSVLRPVKPNLVRNADIVGDTHQLVGCPDGPETLRSGTWSTIRRARAYGRPVTVIWPDGSIEFEAGR